MDRVNQENRILYILKTINHPISEVMKNNLSIFSAKELTQILDYLETGSLNPIYSFFNDKKNEYIGIINNIKILKGHNKLRTIKIEERLEVEKQKKELEMIDFDF